MTGRSCWSTMLIGVSCVMESSIVVPPIRPVQCCIIYMYTEDEQFCLASRRPRNECNVATLCTHCRALNSILRLASCNTHPKYSTKPKPSETHLRRTISSLCNSNNCNLNNCSSPQSGLPLTTLQFAGPCGIRGTLSLLQLNSGCPFILTADTLYMLMLNTSLHTDCTCSCSPPASAQTANADAHSQMQQTLQRNNCL